MKMLSDKITGLILSCSKFSDLWDGNIKLFNENWPDKDFGTFIVTDGPTDVKYPGVGIIAAGEGVEWSERLSLALKQVRTEFVFVTMDDYYLVKPVDSQRIADLVALMEKEGYDYLRLYPRPKRATREEVPGYKGVYHVDTTCNYSVNLYSGIWRRSFLEYAIREPKTAWDFEVSLSKTATEYNAKCICSYNDEYSILDVVRKGKILHRANRYFKKHPGIYSGDRPLQSWGYEAGLWIKTMFGRHSSGALHAFLKKVYLFFGGVSYINNNKEQ